MIAAIALAGVLFALWLLSLRLKDSSIIDLFWGPAFVLIAWVTAAQLKLHERDWLVLALVSVWGLRLAGYLAWRNLGHGEDKRYTAMRNKHGKAWWWRSLFIVFGLQGVLAWIVSAPVRGVLGDAFDAWTMSDLVGTVLVVTGISFETIGDLQLARFKARPENKGKIMDRGLWRFTRHPNYFGDFLVWWGFGVFGVMAGDWWSVLGPIVMTVLLVKVSGKELLEAGMKSRPGYAEYVARTSGFTPWFPRSVRAESRTDQP